MQLQNVFSASVQKPLIEAKLQQTLGCGLATLLAVDRDLPEQCAKRDSYIRQIVDLSGVEPRRRVIRATIWWQFHQNLLCLDPNYHRHPAGDSSETRF